MSNSTIAKSAIGVTFVMILGYALSFVKEAVIANYFGISEDVDAYTIAIQIPVILFSFIAVAIQSVVVPLYSDLLYNKNKSDADMFASNLITIVIVGTTIFCILGEIFASGIVCIFAPGFSDETNTLSSNLLRITLPTVFFSLTTKIFTAILNVQKKYVFPELSLIVLNGILILTIVLIHAKFGIYAACLGQLFGCIFQIFFLYVIIRKYFKYSFILDFKDKSVIKAMKMSLPVFWSISVAELNAMINRMVASFLFVGSIASLSYAQKLNSIFITFFTSAIATIVYPMFAESASKGDTEQLIRRINISISAYAFILLPVMVYVILYSKEIVMLAFARGAFDYSAVDTTSGLLSIYAFGILFLVVRGTITNVFYSLKDSKTPAINATIGIIINAILNLTLPFIIGLDGIALASMISAIYISSMLLVLLIKKNPLVKLNQFYENLKNIVIATLGALSVIVIVKIETANFSVIINLIVGFLSIAFVYLFANFAMKTPVFMMLVKTVRNKFSK